MRAYHFNGSWNDVTASCRNEIVFEGRNKEYGAYVLRLNYSKSLVIAILLSTSIAIIGGCIPAVFRLFRTEKKGTLTKYFISSHPINYKEKIKVPVYPPPPKPSFTPAKAIKNLPL